VRHLLTTFTILLVLAPFAAAQSPPPEPALPSTRAASSQLLDVASAGPRLVAVGHRGHVVLSDDGGKNWRQAREVPVRTTLTAVRFIDDRHGWITGHDAVILRTRDGGDTWHIQHRDPALEAPLFSLWFEDARHGLAVGAYGLALRTRDGGRTWERFSVSGEEDLHMNRLFVAANGALLIAAELGAVYRSVDRGASWEALDTGSPGSLWSGLALRDGSLLVFGLRGHLYRSEDSGEHWTAVATANNLSLTAALEVADGGVIIVGLGGALLQSGDGGRTFKTDSIPGLRNYSAMTHGEAGTLLLFGDNGVERIEVGGETP
jgi:photosystem II stability/assembly factor-like uncharacterized protein